MTRLLTVFDRVGIICPGSAEIWGRDALLNRWIRRAIAEVRSAGVACFRCSRQMEQCEISVDGMHLSNAECNKKAMGEAVLSVYRYLNMTIPPRANFLDDRIDSVDAAGAWTTALNPDCKLKLFIDGESCCLTQNQVHQTAVSSGRTVRPTSAPSEQTDVGNDIVQKPNITVRSLVRDLTEPVTSSESYQYMGFDVTEWMDDREGEIVINFLDATFGHLTEMLKFVDGPACRTYIMARDNFPQWLSWYKSVGCYHVRDISHIDSHPPVDAQLLAPVQSESQHRTKVVGGTCSFCNQPKHLLHECAEFNKIKCWWCRSKEHNFNHCPEYITSYPQYANMILKEREDEETRRKLKARVEYINWYTSQGKCFYCRTDDHTYRDCYDAGKHQIFNDCPVDPDNNKCFICGETDHIMVNCHWICQRSYAKLCVRCGSRAHVTSACDAIKCFMCGKFGHKQNVCPKFSCDLPASWAVFSSSSSSAAVPSVGMTSAAVPSAGKLDCGHAKDDLRHDCQKCMLHYEKLEEQLQNTQVSEDVDMSTEKADPGPDATVLLESKPDVVMLTESAHVDLTVDAASATGVTSGPTSIRNFDARVDQDGVHVQSDGRVTVMQNGDIVRTFASQFDCNQWLDKTLGSADVRWNLFKDTRTIGQIQEQPKAAAAVPAKAMPVTRSVTQPPPPPPVPVGWSPTPPPVPKNIGKGKGKNNVCDRCGSKSHSTDACVARGCFSCGVFGHKQDSCPARKLEWPPISFGSEPASASSVRKTQAIHPTAPVVSNSDKLTCSHTKDALDNSCVICQLYGNMIKETASSVISPEPVVVPHACKDVPMSGEAALPQASEDVLMSAEEAPPNSNENTPMSGESEYKWKPVAHGQWSKVEAVETVPQDISSITETAVYVPEATLDQPIAAVVVGGTALVEQVNCIPCRYCGKHDHDFAECPEQLPKKRRFDEPIVFGASPVDAACIPAVAPSMEVGLLPNIARTVDMPAELKPVIEALQHSASSDANLEESKRARVSETQPISTPPMATLAQVSVQTVAASLSEFAGSSSSSFQPDVMQDQVVAVPSAELGSVAGAAGSVAGSVQSLEFVSDKNFPGSTTVAGHRRITQAPTMTPEEAAPIKEKFAIDRKQCLDNVASIFCNEYDWQHCKFEKNRIARWNMVFEEDGGHLATVSEILRWGSGSIQPPPIQLINLLVSLLQGRVELHDEEFQPVTCRSHGWARIDIVLEIIAKMWPSTPELQLDTLIDCIWHDPARRLELYVSHVAAVPPAGRDADNHLPTHVRTLHGHDKRLGIPVASVFGSWQKFNYEAPKYVYHFTTPSALSDIARANEICPGGLTNDRGVQCVYCSPVHANADLNLPGCARKPQQTSYMVLDFYLMLSDGISAFYAADGTVCVVGPIQSGYVVHVSDLQYGETWFFRNFEITKYGNSVQTVEMRRQSRLLKTFPCIVCGGLNWMGFHVCFHCTRPHFYPYQMPKLDEVNPRWQQAWIIAPSEELLARCKKSLHEARRLKGQVPYAVFNLKPPSQEVLKRRHTNSCGNPCTLASTFDKSQDRWLKSLNKNVTNYPDVMDRIKSSAPFRINLANHLLHLDCYPNPAQYLLSRYCTYALTLARQLDEVEQITPLKAVQLNQFADV